MNRETLLREVYFKATRGGGPGGQHVNKVSTSAVLYWAYEYSPSLSENQKYLIRTKLEKYINKEDEIYIRSSQHRDLDRNKEQCLDKLLDHLKIAFFKPKRRKATKPTRGSKERRLKGKSEKSQTKKLRQKPDF